MFEPSHYVCVPTCTICTSHSCLLRYHGHRVITFTSDGYPCIILLAVRGQLIRRHFLQYASHSSQVHAGMTQSDPVHERMAWFQGHLVAWVACNNTFTDTRTCLSWQTKNVVSTNGPSTFCAAWFGGHMGPAPAPRHNANRYPGAVYYPTAWDAQPRAKSSPLHTLYLCFCLILLPPSA